MVFLFVCSGESVEKLETIPIQDDCLATELRRKLNKEKSEQGRKAGRAVKMESCD